MKIKLSYKNLVLSVSGLGLAFSVLGAWFVIEYIGENSIQYVAVLEDFLKKMGISTFPEAAFISIAIALSLRVFRFHPYIKKIRDSLSHNYKGISIVGYMAEVRYVQTVKQLKSIFGVSIITIVVLILIDKELPSGLLMGITCLSLLLIIRHFLFSYRVKNGFYGSNIKEAKEIVLFIKSNNSDITGGPGGGGRIFEPKEKNISSTASSPIGVVGGQPDA